MTAFSKPTDRLHAVADTACPESIRYIPNLMNKENFRALIVALGLDAEFKIAAATNDHNIDVGIIDAALARTRLSIPDRIQAKIWMTGSDWKGIAF